MTSQFKCVAMPFNTTNSFHLPTLGLCIMLSLALACGGISEASPSVMDLGGIYELEISGPEYSFLVMGDWGMGNQQQLEIASQMRSQTRHDPKTKFLINVGDNFYQDGVQNVSDVLWDKYFTEVYTGLDVPFLTVLGNHDYKGNVSAQVDYKGDERWMLPGRYYAVLLHVVDSDSDDVEQPTLRKWSGDVQSVSKGNPSRRGAVSTVLWVFLDTTPFFGSYYVHPENANMERQIKESDYKLQLDWAEVVLETFGPLVDGAFVVGHHPVYTDALLPNSLLRLSSLPSMDLVQDRLLSRSCVTAFYCGHVHQLQAFSNTDGNSTAYFISGAAATGKVYQKRSVSALPFTNVWVNSVDPGFMKVSYVPQRKQFVNTFLDANGGILYSTTIPMKNARQHCGPSNSISHLRGGV